MHACGTLSIVSKKFGSAAKSNHVWKRFLPIDIISRRAVSDRCMFDDPWKKIDSDTLRVFPTKKNLYLFLSDNPLLIDDGAMYFWLEKLSGNNCFRIAPRKLIIRDPEGWKVMNSSEEPRHRHVEAWFHNVPVLHLAKNLEIEGKISTSLLSPNTNYTAYLLFSFSVEYYFYGFGLEQSLETWVGIDGHGEKRNVYRGDIPVSTSPQYPVWRHGRWHEVELGNYINKELGVDSSELQISLREVKRGIGKGGIILYGIEIRPKSSK